jgi:thiol-disulfide isomerase/thioredoxin
MNPRVAKAARARAFFNAHAAIVGALLLISASLARADEENAAFANFQQAAEKADIRKAEDTFEKNHPDPRALSEADVQNFAGGMVAASLDALGQARDFEKRFPQSVHVAAVRNTMADMLSSLFGAQNFPLPPNRTVDVEAYTHDLIRSGNNSVGLSMVLCRVGARLPPVRGRALLAELTGDTTPEPARTMARDFLKLIERVGLPLDLSFTTLDGHPFKLTDLKGKVVVLDFWATTCVPCVRQMPDLKALYSRLAPQGLEIVGISEDSDKSALSSYLDREKITWPQYFDPASDHGPVPQEFGVHAIPTIWLVDRHGILRDVNGREDLARKLEALIQE